MNQLLLKIANTLVANLANTESPGLFDGKMGVSLFLYRYARHSGYKEYENIASDLLDEVFRQLSPGLSPSPLNGTSGIGWGISTLLKEKFLEASPEDAVFSYVDEALLRNVRNPLAKELSFPISVFSPGVYLLARMSWQKDNVENAWIAGIMDNARSILANAPQKKKILKLSLLTSMLYTFNGLYKYMEINKGGIKKIIDEVLALCIQAIDDRNYQDIDILLLKQLLKEIPSGWEESVQQIQEKLIRVKCFEGVGTLDVWYDNAWWGILYHVPIVADLSVEEVRPYLEHKMRNSYYDASTVNGKLSSAGIWLMQK